MAGVFAELFTHGDHLEPQGVPLDVDGLLAQPPNCALGELTHQPLVILAALDVGQPDADLHVELAQAGRLDERLRLEAEVVELCHPRQGALAAHHRIPRATRSPWRALLASTRARLRSNRRTSASAALAAFRSCSFALRLNSFCSRSM